MMKKAAALFALITVLSLICGALVLAAEAAPTAKPEGPYTLEEARLLISERIPAATLTELREAYDEGYTVYEGYAADADYTYEFEIDPQTGRFLEWDMNVIRRRAEATSSPGFSSAPASDGQIGTVRAREIALAQVGEGASIRRIKLENDDGRLIYAGKGDSGRFEFEFEIDALTGAILDWEWDD